MTVHRRNPPRRSCLSRSDIRRLGNPLDFIDRDHRHEREICGVIDRIAAAEDPGTDDILLVLTHLGQARPLHLRDEDEDLFPLMRRRCPPEDAIDGVIARLDDDRRRTGSDVALVTAILGSALAAGAAPSEPGRADLAAFAMRSRRYLVAESAILLPIARARLDAADLECLCRGMLRRRGLDRVMETADACRPA